MMKSAVESFRAGRGHTAVAAARQGAILVAASLFVAVCARLTLPLPFTPVPLTLQNFGVLLVGLALGPRRAFAAMLLYLAEGAAGMPVFNPLGPGGVVQLFGPTGGYLLAYPCVAAIAGLGRKGGLGRAMLASLWAEVLLFGSGAAYFMLLTGRSLAETLPFTVYPFCFAEIIKIMGAAGLAPRAQRIVK